MSDDTANQDAGFIRITEPDVPVYRIFPLWFLEEAIRLKHLVLVAPELWEDPCEFVPAKVGVTDQSTTPWTQIFLDRHLCPVFAQAWSLTGESDTLLRAYSRVIKDPHSNRNTCPREEGVRVCSTPRKLLSVLQKWRPGTAKQTCFIGAVRYLPRQESQQQIEFYIKRYWPKFEIPGRVRAELQLLKRAEYVNEAEIRLIYIDEKKSTGQNLVRVPFQPNEVFEEILFDPRLATFERKEREEMIRKLDYIGKISDSDFYQNTLLDIYVGGSTSNSHNS